MIIIFRLVPVLRGSTPQQGDPLGIYPGGGLDPRIDPRLTQMSMIWRSVSIYDRLGMVNFIEIFSAYSFTLLSHKVNYVLLLPSLVSLSSACSPLDKNTDS